MKALAILLLASLPVPQVPLPIATSLKPEPHFAQHAQKPHRKGGKWYFARTGHAVYCYGPVMTLMDVNGEMQHVATFCRGDQLLVPLKD
jgi:hypothetical protein